MHTKNYYILEKSRFAKWKKRPTPEWFNGGTSDGKRTVLGLHGKKNEEERSVPDETFKNEIAQMQKQIHFLRMRLKELTEVVRDLRKYGPVQLELDYIMPTYRFYDTVTQEEYDEFMLISELDEYKKLNPDVNKCSSLRLLVTISWVLVQR